MTRAILNGMDSCCTGDNYIIVEAEIPDASVLQVLAIHLPTNRLIRKDAKDALEGKIHSLFHSTRVALVERPNGIEVYSVTPEEGDRIRKIIVDEVGFDNAYKQIEANPNYFYRDFPTIIPHGNSFSIGIKR